MRIGFIGLGRMGANMVRRLIRDGHEIAVYNRTSERTTEIAAVQKTPSASHFGTRGRWYSLLQTARKLRVLPNLGVFWGFLRYRKMSGGGWLVSRHSQRCRRSQISQTSDQLGSHHSLDVAGPQDAAVPD